MARTSDSSVGASSAGDRIDQLRMTPMIDVVFQLLIFFMVGMHLKIPDGILHSHLPKDVPNRTPPPPNEDPPPPPPSVTIRVVLNDGDGQVGFLFGTRRCDSIEALEDKLVEFGALDGASEFRIVIDASPRIEFRHVLGVVNACARAKLGKVSFRPPPSGDDRS